MLYGDELTLYCGDQVFGTPLREWYHNGGKIGIRKGMPTVTNANFDDDGEYQCRRNGTNVFPTPVKVDVYGKI